MNREIISEFRSNRLVYNHLKYTEVDKTFVGTQVHDVFEILYLKQGELTYYVEGKKYNVKKNGLLLTKPNASHTIIIEDTSVYERYDFLFENRVVLESILKKLPDSLNVINLNDYPQVSEIFSKMDYYCQHFKGDELKKILSNLVEEIIYNVVIVADKYSRNQLNGNYSANPTIAAAIDYIDNNLTRHFTITDLCKQLFISKSSLHQLFIRHMQTTPQKYITLKRLLLAQKKIRAFEKPTDIYCECGFSDYTAFFRAYKKHFGYPPSKELNQKIVRIIEF